MNKEFVVLISSRNGYNLMYHYFLQTYDTSKKHIQYFICDIVPILPKFHFTTCTRLEEDDVLYNTQGNLHITDYGLAVVVI